MNPSSFRKVMTSYRRVHPRMLAMIVVTGILVLTACVGSDSPKYSRFVSIDPRGWSNSEYCVFNISEFDSTAFVSPAARYDVILSVRHTTNYPYNNLWIIFEKQVRSDSIFSTKVNLRLAEPNGSWRGHGMQGLYEFSDTVVRGITLSKSDVISIHHDMPVTSLPGLIDFGLTIVSSRAGKH